MNLINLRKLRDVLRSFGYDAHVANSDGIEIWENGKIKVISPKSAKDWINKHNEKENENDN
jgi:hypothetical protein